MLGLPVTYVESFPNCKQYEKNGPASDSRGDAYSNSRLEGLGPRLGLISGIRPRGNQTSPPAIMSLSIGSIILWAAMQRVSGFESSQPAAHLERSIVCT